MSFRSITVCAASPKQERKSQGALAAVNNFDVPDDQGIFKSGSFVAIICSNNLGVYTLADKAKHSQTDLEDTVQVVAFELSSISCFKIVVWSTSKFLTLQVFNRLFWREHVLPCKRKPKLTQLLEDKVAWIDFSNMLTVFQCSINTEND